MSLIQPVPKLCGADVELGNFLLGLNRDRATGGEASRALLREIEGLPHGEFRLGGNYDPQDWGRKFLPANGGCAYIDLDHLEICLPEVWSAEDFVACWHAMLRMVRAAQSSANARLPEGVEIQVLANNSDGQGNSYGSHLDFLVSRRMFDNLFQKKLHHLLFLASYQASSIVFTGQGKVGAENGAPDAPFQLSQRADFFETLAGPQTTYRRPLVNSRDEALCGQPVWGSAQRQPARDLARLHVIFYDSNLCQVATYLKVGVLQVILTMLEAEECDPALILDDPLGALAVWSRDPSLQSRARTTTGREVTAVELQLQFLDQARRFLDRGGCGQAVPGVERIVALWADTLGKLQRGDLAALAPRLDWVLKLSGLLRVMDQRRQFGYGSPEIRHLDQVYSSLDASEGLYWAYESAGLVERVTGEDRVRYFTANPPEDTRAWTRAMLLRTAGAECVESVDWDSIKVRPRGRGYWSPLRHLEMADPLAFTRVETEAACRQAETLEDLLDALEAPKTASAPAAMLN